ncbi:enoyl-CoA hydratase [Cupriavidus basilensis]|uniref:enoyl-CoA hydratase n=1 Tax=Cupriavidus basilensis TaxID=68895 RepID=UPI0023E81BEA|nr:enoyl-CoA hydratase [Cupriavidus basilensis]MDF3882433.1 enoyl-CoA hydratase [Cupriavidus basilensis]
MMKHIQARNQNGVLTLSMSRAEKKNALTQEMYLTLALALEDAGRDDSVRVVVLRGTPTVFSSGNDIQDFADDGSGQEKLASVRFMKAVTSLQKPIVAAVCGYAVGIGATVLLHCDYVVASEDARIRFPFVDLGLCPEFGSTLLLPALVGQQKASEWMLLGSFVLAGEAQKAGLVNRVLPNDMVFEEVDSIARSLAKKPPAALSATRQLLKSASRELIESRIQKERDIFQALRATEDAQAIFNGFLSRSR